MHENICLQCNKLPTKPSNRLVRDSCGHEKCRCCLLEDENQCKQCVEEKKLRIDEFEKHNKNLKYDANDEAVKNHTGVIQVNGNVPSTSNINGEHKPHHTIETLENKVLETRDNDNAYESLKVENKNIIASRIKKPDKQKRPYNTVIIPKHVTVISDPPSYHCTVCDKSFSTKTHIKYHTYCNGAAKPYKCEHCGKEFILRAQLDVHSYKHKPVKPYTCTICKKSFSVRSKLTRHFATHSQVKSHICSICGNAYRSKESLKIHFVIHKSDKPFSCKICSAKFSNQSNLNKHAAVHTKEKAHMCDLCGKRYKLKWALSVHKLSHSKARSFECNVCYKKFIYKKDLQRHSLIHEESKQYKCSVCSTTFRRQDNLRRHMKNTHPGKKAEVIKNVLPARSKILSTTTVTTKTTTFDSSSVNNNKKDIHIPVDNPNAINVITTASVACSSIKINREETEAVTPLPSAVKSDSRAEATGCTTSSATSVINGPIKLAFKPPAFKSYYNINRDFNHMPAVQLPSSYNIAESVEICQKILSTDSSLSSRNIIPKTDSISQEICQKILDPNSRPIHYETSFQNKQHAMIKNIKFKVPVQYTNQFKENGKSDEGKNDDSSLTFTELKPVAMTSVIVNSNDLSESGNLYWRRRTSQNLSLKK